jgi:hypothetical protein
MQDDRADIFKDLLPAIIELEANLGHRWRHTVALLKVLGGSSDFFPLDAVRPGRYWPSRHKSPNAI